MLVAGPATSRCCSTSSSQAPDAARATAREAELRRSTCPSATPRRSSTSGRPPAGSTGTPAGVCEAQRALGHACRWPSSRRPPRGSPARAWRSTPPGLRRGDPRRPAHLDARVRGAVGARGHVLREGETLRNPELGDALELLGREGAEPFYRGEIAAAVCDWLGDARRLALRAATSPATRRSSASRCGSRYRDREILTNPPPSAGGTLLAYALGAARPRALAAGAGRRSSTAMAAAQAERTAEFLEGLDRGRLPRALPLAAASARRRTSR